MGSIVGYVPSFGLLKDDGRKADWIIEIKTTKKPEAQLLGSAIGMKVILLFLAALGYVTMQNAIIADMAVMLINILNSFWVLKYPE